MSRETGIRYVRVPAGILGLGIKSAYELIILALAVAFADEGLKLSNTELGALLRIDRRHVPRIIRRLETRGRLTSSTVNGSRILKVSDTIMVSISRHQRGVTPDTKVVQRRHQSGAKVTPVQPCPSITEGSERTEYPPEKSSQEAGGKERPSRPCAKSDILVVFECWNSYGGQSIDKADPSTGQTVHVHWPNRKLKADGAIPVDAETAIRAALKGFGVDDAKAAISNFAAVLLSSETFWTYGWSLTEFFTRREGRTKDSGYKWWRFLPGTFDFEKYRLRRSPDTSLNLDGSTEDEIWAAYGKEPENVDA